MAVIKSAYYSLWIGSPSMDGRPVGGKIGVHEMYGVNHWGCLPSIGMHPSHGWEAPIHGR